PSLCLVIDPHRRHPHPPSFPHTPPFRSGPAAVVVNHTNPCGAAMGDSLAEAYRAARDADALSAFGGIVALSAEVDEETALRATKIGRAHVCTPVTNQTSMRSSA